ncbi:RNA helicase [Coprinopsis cinerea AmutBmut pab1-1]|nr:RNA helicase [Coprinopsis cinerea AmutBmut pab1-1]
MKWPKAIVLRPKPSLDDEDWHFNIPPQFLSGELRKRRMLKISMSGEGISLDTDSMSSNRILHSDDPTKFILLALDRTFRFPDHPPRTTTEYLNRMFKAGVFLNGVQYRFYHHSNSQLRGRSCFLREANSDKELDDRIYALGDFSRINNVAKRAKRIGLLFSSAEVDFNLDPTFVEDIGDIEIGGEVFSDGCGLISKSLTKQIAKAKKLMFRGIRYTPVVIQIRYEGYKGVLMLHPDLDERNRQREPGTPPCYAQFRKSMKKFKATSDHSFSVVGYSKPYSFGRLNNDIITLIHSLGVTKEKLVAKQQEYFDWIASITQLDTDPTAALDFLSCTDKYAEAEAIFLHDAEERSKILNDLRKYQLAELARHHDTETGKFKTRMVIHKSRRLFGVCDPYQVLKEGQVHIRITAGRKGPATPIHGDVLVVRNPCLHPGDCLKLRAVDHPQLSHLVDCLVFASAVRRPGSKPAPSLSSGGDLDGDEFFVCWDQDLVPPRVSEPYDYPPNKEPRPKAVTRADLANHFASYTSSGVAKVSALHNKWAISSPLGALCVECQELNALHSQSVDGAPIKIPERLQNPPEPDPNNPFIIDVLKEHEEKFEAEFRASPQVNPQDLVELDAEHAQQHIEQLFKSNQKALSEFELFELALRFSRKHGVDIRPFLTQIDISALTSMQKATIKSVLDLSRIEYPYLWNSLFQSDILSSSDLRIQNLDSSISLQKLYSSRSNSQATFFEYLRKATQDYTRKLLLLRTDDRFAVGIFMRGPIPWDEEPEVAENVVAVSFMDRSSAHPPTHHPCSKGYRLHCSYSRFQLYDRHIGDTFVFLQRSPTEHQTDVVMSVALQKFSQTLRRQLGRVNRTPLVTIELHVVSNHDRVAHQLFDLWYDHVPTEEYIPRFVRKSVPYRANDLRDVEWTPPRPSDPDLEEEEQAAAQRKWLELTRVLEIVKSIVYPYPQDMHGVKPNKSRRQHSEVSIQQCLVNVTPEQLDFIMSFLVKYHAEEELYLVFGHVISGESMDQEFVGKWIDHYPPLVFTLLRTHPPTDDLLLPETLAELSFSILRAIVRSANETRIAALVALEKLAATIARISTKEYLDILLLSAHSARSRNLSQELLLVLHESRLNNRPQPLSASDSYLQKHSLGIVFDRAEEAADECPCNDDGMPRKQRTAPAQATLIFSDDSQSMVKASVRLDARTTIRLHSHVRLKAVSKAENKWLTIPVLDGLVVQMTRGELGVKLIHPAPPELEQMQWVIYDAGGVATTQAMLDALLRLILEQDQACAFYHLIVGASVDSVQDESGSEGQDADPPEESDKGKGRESCDGEESDKGDDPQTGVTDDDEITPDDDEMASDDDEGFVTPDPEDIVLPGAENLNDSQLEAIASWNASLSLIWGPPGTGKTTVVVEILRSIILTYDKLKKRLPTILMTASTHNAVDNVLERFLRINNNEGEKLINDDKILRVATDQSRVGDALLPYTVDARVGGDVNQNQRRMKDAERRVKQAKLIFTTCAGAGLGVLRKFQFDIAIIDEASQITEPCALIPLVKGVKRAIMVGDHVQLRPTVGKYGRILEYDVSLLERLYSGEDLPGLKKTMLNIQYRSPRVLNAFPSKEFYEDKLETAPQNEGKLAPLENLQFPWPRERAGAIIPTIFVPCSIEEDVGGRSKSNEGQVSLVARIVKLLKPKEKAPESEEAGTSEGKEDAEEQEPLEITVLSPYRGQNDKLRHKLRNIPVSTVDGFQGRESDIIIFSTVRCNANTESTSASIGFLDDPRRLNVMWTRARLALIIVGDRRTLSDNSELWKRAISACQVVEIPDDQE